MKDKILVLCTGNSCRSQMTEAFFREFASDRFDPVSAGLETKEIHPMTTSVMAEVNIDISKQYSKSIKEVLGKERFQYVIFVCSKAEKNCPSIYPFAVNKLSWPFDDPAAVKGDQEEQLAAFRRVRDQIKEKVIDWLKHSH